MLFNIDKSHGVLAEYLEQKDETSWPINIPSMMKGNEAIGEAAIRAGCTNYFAFDFQEASHGRAPAMAHVVPKLSYPVRWVRM